MNKRLWTGTIQEKMNEKLGILYHNFNEGIKAPSLRNYKETLKSGIEILRISATKHEGLPVLKYIFECHFDFNDLCFKLEQYFCTNVHFKYYRYTRYNEQYKEEFNLDFSKHDIRSLLILIRCNYISQGSISPTTNELIKAYEYIDQVKDKTSLETLKSELPTIEEKYIANRYKDSKYKVSRAGEYAKMINANLYLLSYNHELFTQSEKNGRTYNAFTSLNRVYRENEIAFQLAEFDIKSANPQIIDKLFNFENWKNVYSNLMEAYNINRNEAKIKYNATLNNYMLSFMEAKEVYLKAGYTSWQADQLANFTAESAKGYVFNLMARHEGEIMQTFIDANFKNKPCIRLHDAVFFEPEFYSVENATEIGVDFGKALINKELLTLDLKMDTYKTVLTTPPTEKFIFRKTFDNGKKLLYNGTYFSFYDKSFDQINARFNINKPIFKDGIFRTPSEVEFIERLQKLFKILYYLNESFEPFFECIEHLHAQEGISFNKNYVYAIASKWHFDINDGLSYIKKRNWLFHGEALSYKRFNEVYNSERTEFINTIGRKQLKKDLKKLYSEMKQGRLYHIDKNSYYYAKRYQAGEIIDQVYELIGFKKVDAIQRFNDSVHILDNLYKKHNITCQKTAHLAKSAEITRRFADRIKQFYINRDSILQKIENAIFNICNVKDLSLIFDHIPPTHQEAEPIQPGEAFPDPITYEGGYFDTPELEALYSTKEYFSEWYIHQHLKKLYEGANGGISANFEKQKPRIKIEASTIYENRHTNIAELMTA